MVVGGGERRCFLEVQKLAPIPVFAVCVVLEICAKFGLVVLVEGVPASQFFFGVGEGALG